MFALTSHTFDSFTNSSRHAVALVQKGKDWRKALHSALVQAFEPIAGYLFWLVMKYLNFRIKKSVNALNELELNYNNFKYIFQGIQKLKELNASLDSFTKLPMDGKPRHLRWIIREIIRTSEIISKGILQITSKIDALDQPLGDMPKGMEVRTTKELWSSRPKSYEYLA